MRVLWLVVYLFSIIFYYLLRARERSNFGAPNKQEQQGKQVKDLLAAAVRRRR